METTAQLIRKVALKQFALHGYDGTSLGQIADDVGIKKQSIYTHFKSKDDLFLHVLADIVEEEQVFVGRYFREQAGKSLQQTLFGFITDYKNRYEKDDQKRFWLRMMYFPPAAHEATIVQYGYAYLEGLERLLVPLFERAVQENEIAPVNAVYASDAFLGVLDAVLIEMLFGGTARYTKRLEGAWHIYWRGLTGSPG
ncbi:TetR/AcrR family transcriptional regulator [Paenibacillus thalictri]|uniref:TetR/AcrR family transcriptional regulator n=1 Tax=Paenibacillus thalictri TaxID=2527873 RepID=A0A4Q9DUW8_9BACL|nr:TetR/AcrR family transcriptional regulator [Paenibacillus thalictri]TBL78580.1 TetR/AcrR family transcriptional regulator [Paenibacillus thalictri]